MVSVDGGAVVVVVANVVFVVFLWLGLGHGFGICSFGSPTKESKLYAELHLCTRT